MTTQQDAFIALKKETTYGTYVAPSSVLTFTQETLEQKPTFVDGTGLRPGRRTTYNSQRAIGKQEFTGDITVDASAAEPGILFEAFMGAGVSTILGTTAYQHFFTMAADYLPSYTVQKSIPPLGGAAGIPFSFTGMQCSGLDLDAKEGGLLSLVTHWMGQALSTTQTAITPTYPAVDELFSYVGGSLQVGGTPTTPTATTLSTGGTSVADVVDISLKLDNALDAGGFALGGQGARTRPAAALNGKHTGTMTAEFRDQTFWNSFVTNLPLALVLNFQGSLIETTFYNALQVYLPIIRLEGETPKIQSGQIVTQAIPFTVLQSPTLSPIYIALRNQNTVY